MVLPHLQPPARVVIRVLSILRTIPTVFVLVAALVLYNCFQLLCLVLVRPFSRRRFRALLRLGAAAWWHLEALLIRAAHKVELRVTGDAVVASDNALLLPNHQGMADITFIAMWADLHSRAGDLKWFVKDALKFVPGIGWGMLLLDNLFVSRNWSRDRESLHRVFQEFVSGRVPYWIVLFAEGTRISAHKMKRCADIARRHGKVVQSHVMIPHTKGFCAAFDGLAGSLDAVYDITIGYRSGIPTLGDYLLGYSQAAHVHVRRFAAADLPANRDDRADWLQQRFVEKDQLLDRFYAQGEFAPPGASVPNEAPAPLPQTATAPSCALESHERDLCSDGA